MIYRITDKRDWQKAQKTGLYRSADLEKGGFIHCCAPEQIDELARRHYPGHHDLLLLEIDDAAIESPVRWENEEEGAEFYPHVYGPIPVSAVGQVSAFRTDSGGTG